MRRLISSIIVIMLAGLCSASSLLMSVSTNGIEVFNGQPYPDLPIYLNGVLVPVTPQPNLIDQWTFDGPNPETGINGTIISTWTTNAPNSVPSAGVLRYANTTDSNWGNGQLLPDIDTSAIDKMIWTIELADLRVSTGSNFRFTGLILSGEVRPELELTAWGMSAPYTFSPDMEYNTNTDYLDAASGISLNATNGTLGGPLTIVATWDFVNNTMTLDMGGGNVSSNTPAANMAASIGTVTGFRMYPRTIAAGDYLDLDSVTIETY
jgi:hypothetical protein